MSSGSFDLLLVGVEPALGRRVAAALDLAGRHVRAVETGAEALELAVTTAYDAVVLGFPLPDLDAARLLRGLRRKESRCRRAAVVLLAEDEPEVAEALCGQGANRVVAAAEAAEALPALLAELLVVAPRAPVRAVGRVEVDLGERRRTIVCQTVNLSASGMLLRTGASYPTGTVLAFELTLPGDLTPVRGRGRVVRQTDESRERCAGVGVAFQWFQADDALRLSDHLDRVAS